MALCFTTREEKGRNGAQLLELGKGTIHPRPRQRRTRRNGAQLLELGKDAGLGIEGLEEHMSQWSPAFRAGKRRTRSTSDTSRSRRNGAQLLELGKGRVGRIPGSDSSWSQWSPAFRAGKRGSVRALSAADCMSQWSPAFRAGKSSCTQRPERPRVVLVAMEPSF